MKILGGWGLPDDVEHGLRHSGGSHTAEVFSVCFSSDSTKAITGSADGTAMMWDVETGHCLKTFKVSKSGVVTSACLSVDNKTILTGSSDNIVKLWDVQTGQARS